MAPFDPAQDALVRKAAFDWLSSQVSLHGDVLPYALLLKGFDLGEDRVPLLGPQGIFKPRVLALPLSLTTVFGGPYDDAFGDDGYLLYRYRSRGGPDHPDNRGVREVMRLQLPLVYLHGVSEGRYLATWPVFVVGDDIAAQRFKIAVDDTQHFGLFRPIAITGDEGEDPRRRYSTAVVRVRLHQRAFRERVLDAYRRQCAFCRLKHDELLDAAHLIPDADPAGDPKISNGVALCTLHHAAFDKCFIGIRPDYVIEVRSDLLKEIDGPTLAHAIQGLHLKALEVPRRREHRPSVHCLEHRYELFRRASRE